jgi:hypothetical protein
MVEGSAVCTAHLLLVPSYTSPHNGAEEQGRGRGGAGWLAISEGQVTTSCSEESKLPTEIIGHVTVEAGNAVGTDGAPPQSANKLRKTDIYKFPDLNNL